MCQVSGSYYIFDRGYNAFKELYKIRLNESYFVVRAKKNLQYKCTKWKRRLPKNILTDSVIELTDVNTQKKYPEKLRLVRFHYDEQDRDFAFLTNAFHLTSLEIANLYKNRWQIELFSSGSSSTSRLRNSGVLQRTLSEYKFAQQS